MLLQATRHNVVLDSGDRFIINFEGHDSYLTYRIDQQTLVLYCAYVPELSRGNGHACSLISHALQYAVLNGLRVKASCQAVKAYIKMNPEWNYILAF